MTRPAFRPAPGDVPAPPAEPHLAGLDVIGSYLIEVNVTSVGALRKADALLGWRLCADPSSRARPQPSQRWP